MQSNRSRYALFDDSPPADVPLVDVDPFSADFLENPYPHHEVLREAGPLVWLSRYSIAATARYEQVRHALLDWQTFSSARGVGMADFEKHGRFRLPSLILEADPPQHSRSRVALSKALSQPIMRKLQTHFAEAAEQMVEQLVQREEFDACSELSEAFPLRVFPDAIGMRRESRDQLLPYGDMVFNSFGPPNEFFQQSAIRAKEAFPWVEAEALREHLSPDGFGMVLYQCADAGEITHDEAHKLVRAILTAGVDTTVNGIGASIYCMARCPEQYAKLRANLNLARAAFEEAIRLESPVQTFFRTTTKATEFGGASLEPGRKVLLFLGAANRDPRKWESPDCYNIERTTYGHVGFGVGIHMCVGQLLARLEGEVVLKAIARHVRAIEIRDEPKRRPNNTLRGLKEFRIRFLRD
jgi:4-methoxybenzoate monooxygenase (O-demethylating)